MENREKYLKEIARITQEHPEIVPDLIAQATALAKGYEIGKAAAKNND